MPPSFPNLSLIRQFCIPGGTTLTTVRRDIVKRHSPQCKSLATKETEDELPNSELWSQSGLIRNHVASPSSIENNNFTKSKQVLKNAPGEGAKISGEGDIVSWGGEDQHTTPDAGINRNGHAASAIENLERGKKAEDVKRLEEGHHGPSKGQGTQPANATEIYRNGHAAFRTKPLKRKEKAKVAMRFEAEGCWRWKVQGEGSIKEAQTTPIDVASHENTHPDRKGKAIVESDKAIRSEDTGLRITKHFTKRQAFESTYWNPDSPKERINAQKKRDEPFKIKKMEYKVAPYNLPFKIRKIQDSVRDPVPVIEPYFPYRSSLSLTMARDGIENPTQWPTSAGNPEPDPDPIPGPDPDIKEYEAAPYNPPFKIRRIEDSVPIPVHFYNPKRTSLHVGLILTINDDENAVEIVRAQWGLKRSHAKAPWIEPRFCQFLSYSEHKAYSEAISNYAANNGPFHIDLEPFVHKVQGEWQIRFNIRSSELNKIFRGLSYPVPGRNEEHDDKKPLAKTSPMGKWTVLAKADCPINKHDAKRLVQEWKDLYAEPDRQGGKVLVYGLALQLQERFKLVEEISPLEEGSPLEEEVMKFWRLAEVFMFKGCEAGKSMLPDM